ncbi:NB-ARC domain-containing protein [Streptomyces sp. NPDC046887]|uniref:NB-ARC domain-containing protein n=1 Tax=Streptomyces sp. NPDC046887 TaxID=3155472 RepID=UPI0033C323C4
MSAADGPESSVRPAVRNSMAGGTVHGPVVMAGAVHGDIAFNYHLTNASGTSDGKPNQVPRPPRQYINHEGTLRRVDALFRSGTAEGEYACPIGVISGLPGVGKTATASQVAYRSRGHFPDGQLFVDFATVRNGAEAGVSDALAMFLRALGGENTVIPPLLSERAARYRSLSSEKRLLVVLDDVSRAAQVTALLPHGPGSAVLATSTSRLGELALDGAELLPLGVLDDESSVRLLVALCGTERLGSDQEAVVALARRCEGLPIALRIVAARLMTHRSLTVRELVDELADEHGRPSRASESAEPEEHGAMAALDLVYRELLAGAARLYRVLGCLPVRTFDTGLAAVAARQERQEVRRHMDVLHEAGLLTATDDGRHRLHTLVARHARAAAEESEPADFERRVVQRAAGHYLALTLLADLAIREDRLRIVDVAEVLGAPERERGTSPFEQGDSPKAEAISWLVAERPNLMAVLRAAVRFGLYRQAWQLAEVLTVLFLHHRHVADWRESLELGIEAAAQDRHPAAEARLRSLLSRPLLDFDQDEPAYSHLEAAERLAVESGHLVLQASVQEFLGRYWSRHDPELAVAAYRLSLSLNAEAGEVRGEVLAAYFLGCALSATGDHGTALETVSEARRRFLSLEDRRMAARALADAGRIRGRLGQREEARDALAEAAAELGKQEALEYQAQALVDLAELQERADRAQDHLREALSLYEKLGSPRAADVRARLAG